MKYNMLKPWGIKSFQLFTEYHYLLTLLSSEHLHRPIESTWPLVHLFLLFLLLTGLFLSIFPPYLASSRDSECCVLLKVYQFVSSRND